MENQTVKRQKVVWAREFHQFSGELEKALGDGWKVVDRTLTMTFMPASTGATGGERYLVIVEK